MSEARSRIFWIRTQDGDDNVDVDAAVGAKLVGTLDGGDGIDTVAVSANWSTINVENQTWIETSGLVPDGFGRVSLWPGQCFMLTAEFVQRTLLSSDGSAALASDRHDGWHGWQVALRWIGPACRRLVKRRALGGVLDTDKQC